MLGQTKIRQCCWTTLTTFETQLLRIAMLKPESAGLSMAAALFHSSLSPLDGNSTIRSTPTPTTFGSPENIVCGQIPCVEFIFDIRLSRKSIATSEAPVADVVNGLRDGDGGEGRWAVLPPHGQHKGDGDKVRQAGYMGEV